MSTNTDEDKTGTLFTDTRWLQLYPLNTGSVLDYFSLSGFYDRTCNNEQIKMQRLDADKITSMRGIEYVLHAAKEPDLYVIKKQKRESPTIAIPLALYYVIRGTIFQSPHIYSVLASRMLKGLYHVKTAFNEAASYQRYNPYANYTWDFQDKEKAVEVVPKTPAPKLPVAISPENEAKKREDLFRIDKMISSLSNQFPIPPPTTIPTLKRKIEETPSPAVNLNDLKKAKIG